MLTNILKHSRSTIGRNASWKPAVLIQQKIVNADAVTDAILRNSAQQSEDWTSLKEELFKLSRRITPVNADTSILGVYITHKKYDFAERFIKHLQGNGGLTLGVIGRQFKLHYSRGIDEGITKEREKEILTLYKSVRKSYPVLDSITNEYMIYALSLTSQWKKCLDAIEEIKYTSSPSNLSYDCTVIAAFRNKDEIAWDLLDEMLSYHRTPSENCYKTYIETIKPTSKTAIAAIEKLLTFLGDNDISITHELAVKLHEFFEKSTVWLPALTKVTNQGICYQCKTKLPKFELSQEEFNELKKAFMEKVIIGKDVFRKTTPTELEEFEELLKKNKQYDVVIDGLNVAYSAGVRKPVNVTSMFVQSVAKHFLDQGKTVLITGRKHMERWPSYPYLKRNADLFLTQNLSQDDPYMLYCTLNSGINTTLVTRDMMRSHIYLMKERNHKRLFKRWLSQSLQPLLRVLGNGKVILKYPSPFIKVATKHAGYWHVPYISKDEKEEWLCVKCKD